MKIHLTKILYSNYSYLKSKPYFRPMVHVGSKMILLYQKYLSKHTCMYTPTCSQYTLECLNRYGFFVGTIMGIMRIIRCNPFVKGGYDPVPEKKRKMKWLK